MMRSRTLFVFLALFSLNAFAHEITTVILVRHAEKSGDASMAKDPPLTPAGEARAEELARMLDAAGVQAIYTTPFERTRKTAAPIAAALKIEPVEIKTGETYAAEIVRRIHEQHPGGTVLVVGHSNSTQQVIQALGIADAPAIADSEYDYLFIVTIAEGMKPRLLTLHYGAVR